MGRKVRVGVFMCLGERRRNRHRCRCACVDPTTSRISLSNTHHHCNLQRRSPDLQKWERTWCFSQKCRVCCTTNWLRVAPQSQSPASSGIEVVINARLTSRTCPSLHGRPASPSSSWPAPSKMTDDDGPESSRAAPRPLPSTARVFKKNFDFCFLFVPKSWQKAGRTSQIETVWSRFFL